VILPEGDYSRVQALAEANNVSTAWVIRAALLRFLEEHGDQDRIPLRLPKTDKALGP
jgi:predicted transcriptional regulator